MNRTEYLYTLLNEESSEIIQAVSKLLRFGPYSTDPKTHQTNIETLAKEINDLYAVIEKMEEEGILGEIRNPTWISTKKTKIEEFMNYSSNIGTLT